MANHSHILASRIPWTEEPGKLQSIGLQRVRHNRVTNTFAGREGGRRKHHSSPKMQMVVGAGRGERADRRPPPLLEREDPLCPFPSWPRGVGSTGAPASARFLSLSPLSSPQSSGLAQGGPTLPRPGRTRHQALGLWVRAAAVGPHHSLEHFPHQPLSPSPPRVAPGTGTLLGRFLLRSNSIGSPGTGTCAE